MDTQKLIDTLLEESLRGCYISTTDPRDNYDLFGNKSGVIIASLLENVEVSQELLLEVNVPLLDQLINETKEYAKILLNTLLFMLKDKSKYLTRVLYTDRPAYRLKIQPAKEFQKVYLVYEIDYTYARYSDTKKALYLNILDENSDLNIMKTLNLCTDQNLEQELIHEMTHGLQADVFDELGASCTVKQPSSKKSYANLKRERNAFINQAIFLADSKFVDMMLKAIEDVTKSSTTIEEVFEDVLNDIIIEVVNKNTMLDTFRINTAVRFLKKLKKQVIEYLSDKFERMYFGLNLRLEREKQKKGISTIKPITGGRL